MRAGVEATRGVGLRTAEAGARMRHEEPARAGAGQRGRGEGGARANIAPRWTDLSQVQWAPFVLEAIKDL